MKLAFEAIEQADIYQAKMLLESNGVPVFVGNENTARNLRFAPIITNYQLWIVLDHQYDDAITLLSNSEHEVSEPVDVEEYYARLESMNKSQSENMVNKAMLVIVSLIGLGFALYLYNIASGV